MSETKYILTMNDEQARTVQRACEFYSRILMGQFKEIEWEMLVLNVVNPNHGDFTDFHERREKMKDFLLKARECAFPELHGESNSYGVGYSRASDIAWNAYTAIRYCRAWHDNPKGGLTVNFDPPLDVSGVGVPKCEFTKD